MRRRDFMKLLAAAAVTARPGATGAQQPQIPVIGYIDVGAPETSAALVAAFRRGLNESGYVEGRNVAIEYRWAHEDYNRLTSRSEDYDHCRIVGGIGARCG
jgi:putative tryptophan/tyrosine transport system substrate-binding protein